MLSSNHIKDLYQLPESLEKLDLSCNHLSHFQINYLPKLQHLDLSCNLISSLTSFSGLPLLKTLYLGYNLLKSLHSLSAIDNLLEIDIEHNMLSSTEDLHILLKSNVLVFTVKNNPGTR